MDFMAIDERTGTTHHALGLHPRKTLLERPGRKHAAKMYVDTKDGETKHIGYVIGNAWLRLYQVEPWKGTE